MVQNNSEIQYRVVITGIRHAAGKHDIARVLARISGGRPLEAILNRLESLPWTITKSASDQTASRIAQALIDQGAMVTVIPPLPPGMGQPAYSLPGPPPPDVMNAAQQDFNLFENGPLTISGILDESFKILRSRFWPLLGAVAIPGLAFTLSLIPFAFVFLMMIGALSMTGGGKPSIWGMITSTWAVVLLAGVAWVVTNCLARGAAIFLVSSTCLGEPAGMGEALKVSLRRLLRFVLTAFIFLLLLLGCLLVTVGLNVLLYLIFDKLTGQGLWFLVGLPFSLIPAAYMVPKVMLYDSALIIEGRVYLDALRRSWQLVSGKADSPWPRGFYVRLGVLLLVIPIINFAVWMLFTLLPVLVGLIVPPMVLIVQLISPLGNFLFQVFSCVCLVVFYYDIRMRKEGLDLKIMAYTGNKM